MLKREITYETFDDETVTEVFYFNLSKPELIELEVEHEEGFGAWIKKIMETNDNKQLLQIFKDIVLMAYGEKSEDGKRFVKNDQLREEFSQSAAYSALFMELATNDKAASNFLLGVLPKDMVGDVQKALDTADVTVSKMPQPPGLSSAPLEKG